MAESVIKIAADFSQFVSGAKNAEKSIADLSDQLKRMGIDYSKAVSTAKQASSSQATQEAKTIMADVQSAINSIAQERGYLQPLGDKKGLFSNWRELQKGNEAVLSQMEKDLIALGNESKRAENSILSFGRSLLGLKKDPFVEQEKALIALRDQLKAAGTDYQTLLKQASATTNTGQRQLARRILGDVDSQLQGIARAGPDWRQFNIGGSGATMAHNAKEVDNLRQRLLALGQTSESTSKKVWAFGMGKGWSGLSNMQGSLSRITGGFAELSRTILRNVTGSRAFASVLMGLTAPLALTVGALGVLGSQFAKTEKQMAQMSAGLSGAWGRSMGMEEAQAHVRALAEEYAVTERSASEAFTSIASNARLPEKMIDPMIKKLGDLQAWLGKGFSFDGAKQTLQELSQAFTIGTRGDGLDNLRTWLNNLGGLDEQTQKQITSLHDLASATDDYGQKGEYLAQIFDLIASQAEGARDEGLIPFNTAIEDAKRALLGLWGDLSNSSAWETFFSLVSKAITLVTGFARAVSVITGNVIGSLADWAGEKMSAVGGWIKDNMPGGGFLTDLFGNLDTNPTLQMAREGFQMMMDFGSGAKDAKKELSLLTVETKNLNTELGKTEEKANKAMAPLNLKAPKTGRRGGGGGRSRVDQDAKAAERYLRQLQEEVDQVNKMNKLQRLEYDVAHNKVKLNDRQLAQARELASIIVERARLEKEAQRAEELRVMQEEKILALKVRQAEFDSKIADYFRSDYASEYATQLLEYAQELERTLSKLNHQEAKELRQAQRDNATPDQIEDIRRYYAERRQIEEQYIRDSEAAFREWWEINTQLSSSWEVGFGKALKNISEQYKDMAKDMQSAVESWASQMSDALADFVRTGKMDFKSLADSILNDIARMASKLLVSSLFRGFTDGWNTPMTGTRGGSGGGSSSSGFWSSIASIIAGLFGKSYSIGGYTGAGGKYEPAGVVHAGEFVINAASTKKLGLDFLNRLNGYADGGYVAPLPPIIQRGDFAGGQLARGESNIQVNIYNQSDATVTTRKNSQTGGVDVFVRQVVDAVAGDIAAGGAVASAMQRAYSLNRGAGLTRTGY